MDNPWDESLSSRRAWIEITREGKIKLYSGRSPHGERGLKYGELLAGRTGGGRSPHGERGLKYDVWRRALVGHLSLSSRRAWIEIGGNRTLTP